MLNEPLKYVTYTLLLIGVIISGLIALRMPFPNEDLFLAFSSGRDVLSGNLAEPDKWSFTMSGKVWIDQSWLSHLIYYFSFLKLSYLGPVLLKGLLLAISLGLLYLRCRSLSVSPGVSLIALILGTLSFSPFLKIRAENFGMLYFIILSNLLTNPKLSNRWRQICSICILAVWSNSHGSFMLGFFLIVIRCIIGIFSDLKVFHFRMYLSRFYSTNQLKNDVDCPDRYPKNETLEVKQKENALANKWHWIATIFAALLVISFVNPYGIENLVIPFKQLFTQSAFTDWVDWRPLLHWKTLFSNGWFKPLSVRPFLILLGILAFLLVGLLAQNKGRKTFTLFLCKLDRSDMLMELLIPLMVLSLVFKFQRMIIFAAPALIPILAILIRNWIEVMVVKTPLIEQTLRYRFKWVILAMITSICIVLIGTIFVKSVVIRYLPSNPLNFEKKAPPIIQQLMHHDISRYDMIYFMKKNNIRGRIFTDIHLSNYLLYHLPEIKLFFDLRAHSFFSEQIIKDYLLIGSPNSTEFAQGQKLMQQLDISFVVLDTTIGYYSDFSERLMKTKQWGSIYRDDGVIILANVLSKNTAHLTADEGLDHLWYEKSSTKVISKSHLSFFMKGFIQPELLNNLKKIQLSTPKHYAYRLIVKAMNGESNCLNEPTKDFLESEALRLTASDYMVSGGAYSILLSLFQVLVILEDNEKLCEPQKTDYKYRKWKRDILAVLKHIKTRYGGF